jgi:hypothetical protein
LVNGDKNFVKLLVVVGYCERPVVAVGVVNGGEKSDAVDFDEYGVCEDFLWGENW